MGLVDTSEYSEFGRSTTRIAIDLEWCWKDWFLVILGETSRYDGLSCYIIDSSYEIWSEEIFDDTIFDRVEADYSYLSSDIEPVDCFFDRYLDMLEFAIDSYTESLEYSFRRVLVIA
jgi:hypothetical protein